MLLFSHSFLLITKCLLWVDTTAVVTRHTGYNPATAELHTSGKTDKKLVRSGSQQTVTGVPKEKSWVSSDCKPTLLKRCLEKLSEEVTFKLRCDRGQDSSECRVSREERIVWRSLGEGIHKSCESTGHEDFRILLKFLPGATGCLAVWMPAIGNTGQPPGVSWICWGNWHWRGPDGYF